MTFSAFLGLQPAFRRHPPVFVIPTLLLDKGWVVGGVCVFPELFGRKRPNPAAGIREAKPLEAPRVFLSPSSSRPSRQLNGIALQLCPSGTRDFGNQHGIRPPKEGLRGSSSSQARQRLCGS